MNEEESIAAFNSLQEALRTRDLGWVLDQVAEQVRAGKPSTREVVERPVDYLWVAERTRGGERLKTRKTRFPATIEYTPQERVLLMLDAIEHAVINTAEMAAHITRFAEKELGQPRVEFRTDESKAPQLSLEGEEAESRAVVAAHLRTLIGQLREEV